MASPEKITLVNELHRAARVNFPRRRVIVKGLNDLFQCDLVEMIKYSKQNKGYKYLLTVIDCFSKYAFVVPLKNKSGKNVTEAMKIVLKERVPKNLQSDLGKEFYNQDFQNLLKTYNINHYSTYSTLKASIVERFNKTIKHKMWKMFSLRGTYKYIDILPTLVKQ